MVQEKSDSTLLPVGSVVTLKKVSSKPMMIYGRKLKDVDDKEWDYMVCPYPEGYMTDEVSWLVNASDIEGLLFIGYQTQREYELRELLSSPDRYIKGASWDWTEY